MTLQLCLLLLAQIGNAPAAPMGSIEGTVLRMGTREALAEIHVALVGVGPGGAGDSDQPKVSVETLTDDAGRFSFKKLQPGTYRLLFFANGYVRQDYGQRTFPGSGSLIKLESGQTMKDLLVELTPTGSVSGTIRDKDQHPLAGVPVQLMRPAFDDEGTRVLNAIGPAARTDDHGTFRFYFVTPGRYYLQAGTPQGPSGFGGGPEPGPNEFPAAAYASVFYPGAADPKFATTIDVLAGIDVRGMDFAVSRTRSVRVRGRVVDGATGQPPEKMRLMLQYRDPVTGFEYDLELRRRLEQKTSPNGMFEYLDVVPGSYVLSASADDDPAKVRNPLKRRGRVPIEVASGQDLEDIVVTLSAGTSIAGRWRLDGPASAQSAFDEDRFRTVGLRPLPPTPGSPELSGKLNPDSTFRIDGVFPGEYRLWNWFQSNVYIKEARFGAVDLLKGPLQFTSRETASLDIVISPNLASLEGTVTDNRLTGARGAQVVLIPDESQPALRVKTARTDQNGHFFIPNIAPGDYKLYAWESIEPNGWFDADVVRKDQQYAKRVHLSELAHQTVDARLIPANTP